MKIKISLLTFIALCQIAGAGLDYTKGKVRQDGQEFTTGAASKAQISLPNGVARMGSDTRAGVDGDSLSLTKGVMLVGSNPARFNRKGLTTEAMNAKIVTKGTALVAYYPKAYLKITCVEGTVRVSLKSLVGEFVTLQPGQMLIINPTDDRLPETVEIDLLRLIETSQLISGPWPETEGLRLLGQGVAGQTADVEKGDLVRTPLVLKGASPEVTLVPKAPAAQNGPPPGNNPPPNNPPGGSGGGAPAEDCEPLFVIENSYPAGTLTRTTGQPKANIVRIVGVSDGVLIVNEDLFADADLFCEPNSELQLRASIVQVQGSSYTPGATYGSEAPAPFTSSLGVPTRLVTPEGVGIRLDGAQQVVLNYASVEAGTETAPGPIYIQSKGEVSVTSSTLRGKSISSESGTASSEPPSLGINNSKLEALNGNIRVNHIGPISVNNSSELLALAGNIALLSNGNSIDIANSDLKALGDLLIDGGSDGGAVSLRDVQMMADSIRVRGYNSDGDGLLIEGGNFSARLLKFYAEGGGYLRFRGNVNIAAADAHLAGQTVSVDSGGAVNITGRGHVHADSHDYNTTGTGTINASGGLNQGNHASKPGF